MDVHIFILRICARRRRCLRGFRWYPYFVYSSGAVRGIRGKQMTPAVASERSIFSENHDYCERSELPSLFNCPRCLYIYIIYIYIYIYNRTNVIP